METFLDRLKAEKDELNERIEKLNAFMGTPAFDELSREAQGLLTLQLSSMETYETCLHLRLVELETK